MSYKAGFVGLIGLPNAGKSTLVNALIGDKVSIVTNKPQTTRQRITGVFSDESMQAVFVDAPGVVQAKKGLNKFLEDEYKNVVEESDVLVAVLNIDEKSPDGLDRIIEIVSTSGKPWIAIINKTDIKEKFHRILILRNKVSDFGVPVFEVSALKKPEVVREDLLAALKERLPESPAPLYGDNIFTTQSVREMSAELIREKCFEVLHQEIPYGLAVRIIQFKEDEGPTVKIYAEIVLSKDNHRAMVIGEGGKRLKAVGVRARKDLETLLGRQVYLDLHVTIKKNWMQNEKMMKELGYVSPTREN